MNFEYIIYHLLYKIVRIRYLILLNSLSKWVTIADSSLVVKSHFGQAYCWFFGAPKSPKASINSASEALGPGAGDSGCFGGGEAAARSPWTFWTLRLLKLDSIALA